MERKTSSFTLTEPSNTYIINSQEVLTRIRKCVPKDKMCTYHSMNKEYLKGLKMVKFLLVSRFLQCGFSFQWWGETKFIGSIRHKVSLQSDKEKWKWLL